MQNPQHIATEAMGSQVTEPNPNQVPAQPNLYVRFFSALDFMQLLLMGPSEHEFHLTTAMIFYVLSCFCGC